MPEVSFTLDPRVYRLSAVKKAAYRFGDRYFAKIETLPDNGIQVRLMPKTDHEAADAIEGEFLNELLDQDLREQIAEETERVRNLLMAQAFSGLALPDSSAEAADYREDPLGIGRSQATKD